ncbi:Mur ligase family protein [Methanosphaera sp.]|jgi:UDP-N-acetylmuramoylalanine--D-glutamate ligase|uniref:Mur ligase family protein n=1 Tax=Methanosphaera sp. TaxID=2666342 RepID=UPI002A5010F7|nr:Mur ligase family protein [Methanobacteriaceae archaeon]MDY2744022.1 Mur ligase family protein [Methanosphaera sp.]
MLVSVVGLGVEGQKATISLLKRGYSVYSSDINKNIDLKLLKETPLTNTDKLDLEIGSHNLDKIYKADAVSVSPSLFNKEICKNVIDRGIFISDILTKHKDIKTIAVTGTNGKTTTSHMIYHILKNQGYKVVIGGNGGGGFSGYNDLLLEANENEYDYMVIEVCDMTLAFCNYVFDIDMVVVTNIGCDHMNVHGTIEHYTEEVGEFIKNKPAILNWNDENLMKIKGESSEPLFFDTYNHPLNLFGKFNLQNAEAARVACNKLGIDNEKIIDALESFESVEGRTIKIKYKSNEIVSGKTDNVDALKAVLEEERFDILIIGTPRKNESCRYQILDYIKDYSPDTLIIFPGLEDTTYEYGQYLNNLGYTHDVLVIKKIKDIIKYIESKKETKIFIGGNGQEKITEITNLLKN